MTAPSPEGLAKRFAMLDDLLPFFFFLLTESCTEKVSELAGRCHIADTHNSDLSLQQLRSERLHETLPQLRNINHNFDCNRPPELTRTLHGTDHSTRFSLCLKRLNNKQVLMRRFVSFKQSYLWVTLLRRDANLALTSSNA